MTAILPTEGLFSTDFTLSVIFKITREARTRPLKYISQYILEPTFIVRDFIPSHCASIVSAISEDWCSSFFSDFLENERQYIFVSGSHRCIASKCISQVMQLHVIPIRQEIYETWSVILACNVEFVDPRLLLLTLPQEIYFLMKIEIFWPFTAQITV